MTPNITKYINDFSLLLRLSSFDLESDEGRRLERQRRIALTAISSAVAKAISIVSAMISLPITLKYLGLERFGMWTTMCTFMVVLSAADLGMGNGIQAAISVLKGKDDSFGMREVVSTGFILLFSAALLFDFIFLGIFRFISWGAIFNVRSTIAEVEASYAVAVFVCLFAINIPFSVVQRVQMGLQEGFVVSIWQSLGSLLGLGLTIIAIKCHGNLPWLVTALMGGPLLGAIMNNFVFFRLQRKDLQPTIKYFSICWIKRLVKSGLQFLLHQLSYNSFYAANSIIISREIGASAVASFAVPERLFSLISIALGLACAPLWAAYGEAIARGDLEWVRKTFVRSIRFAAIVSASCSIVLVVLAPAIVEVWIGRKLEIPYSLTIGLGVWVFLVAVDNALSAYLYGANRVRFLSCVTGITAVVALILKITWAHVYGVSGIVWGGVVAYCIFSLIPFSLKFRSFIRAQ